MGVKKKNKFYKTMATLRKKNTMVESNAHKSGEISSFLNQMKSPQGQGSFSSAANEKLAVKKGFMKP